MEVLSDVLALASGKGGVGKSIVAANLAEALAREGRRVALIDADFGQSALPVLLNETPSVTVLDTVQTGADPTEALHETETGVTLVQAADHPSASGAWHEDLYAALDGLIEHLSPTCDHVLIDTPAGTDGPVRWALDRADVGVLVLVGEPTAVADAYRLAKLLWTADPDYPLATVVNYAENEDDAEGIAERFGAITTRFLGTAPRFLGWVPYAHAIRHSVSTQTPVVRSPGPARDAFAALAQSVVHGRHTLSLAAS